MIRTRAAFPDRLTRPRLALLVIVAAAVVLCLSLCLSLWVNEGPLWQIVLTRTVRQETVYRFSAARVRGSHQVARWTLSSEREWRDMHYWYVETGFKAPLNL